MTEPKKKLSWTLSILFHTVLAIVIVRAGYKMAFPEASVESVSFEVAQQAAAPAVAPEPQAPVAKEPEAKPEPKAFAPSEPPPKQKVVRPVFIPAPQQNDIQPADSDEELPMVIPEQEQPSQEPQQEAQQEPQQIEAPAQVQPVEAPIAAEAPPQVAPQESGAGTGDQTQPSAAPAAEDIGEPRPAFGAPGSIIGETKLTERPGNRKPSYPWSSRLKRQQGTVIIKAYIRPDGTVDSPSLYQSSGFPALDKEALEAYPKWRYTPGAKGWVLKPFKFSLVDSK